MTKIKLEGLKPDTDYFAQVRALLPEKQFSEWSLRFEFTTISDQSTPKTPANVTWTAGDRFYRAQYDTVTKNVDETDAEILRYEVEISNAGQTYIISTTPDSDAIQKWRISSEDLRVRFGNVPSQVGFRVRAVNFSEKASAWSSLITASIGAPNPPTNAVVTEIESGVKLEWTAPVNMTNVLGYRVYVSTNPSFVPSAANRVYEGPATNYTYNTLTFQLHYFKIRSYSEYGVESTDLNAQGTPKSPFEPDDTPPAVPGGLTVVAVGTPPNKSAKVSWTFDATGNNQDVHQFVIKWRKVGETDWNMDFASKEARTLTIPLPQPFANYEFQIGVLDWVGNYSAYSSTVTLTQSIPGPPPQVTGLTATGSLDGLAIKWSASTADDVINGGFYEVQIATNSGFTTGLLNYKTGNTYLDVNGLLSSTTYYVRVRAVDVENSSGTYSSTLTTATTAFPVTPLSDGAVPSSSPAATVTGGIGYLFVNWPATTNADPVTYEVHISTTNNFTPAAGTKVAETGATNIILEKDAAGTNLAYGTTYYVKLLAKDRDGVAAAYGTQGSGTPVRGTISDLTLSAGDVGAPTIAQAQGYANTAQSNAISTAATDATTKANQALADANTYTNNREAAITTAYNNAITTSANGKNKITHSTSTPGTTANIAGDTWFQYNGSDQIIAQFRGIGGTSWVSETVASQVIANLDVGKLTTGTMSAAIITLSATGQIKSTDYVANSAGWSLSNGGLQINDGIVDAKVLKANTAITNNLFVRSTLTVGDTGVAGFVQSKNYVAGTSGWSLGQNSAGTTLLEINQGAIKIGAVSNLQSTIDSAWQNRNAYFADWTSTFPTGVASWSSTAAPTKETTITRSGQSMRFNEPTTNNRGVDIAGMINGYLPYEEYITIESDVYLVSGNFSGSGILVDFVGVSAPNRVALNFNSIEPTPTTGRWYRFTQTFKRPTVAGTWTSWNAWAMANYAPGLSATSAKDIIFDKIGFRASTQEEITAYNAPGNLSSGLSSTLSSANSYADTAAGTARTNAVNDLKTLWGHPSNTTLIDGGDIFTNSIKATSIALADFTNYIADPYFEQTNNPNGLAAGTRRLSTDPLIPANAPYPQVWGFANGTTAPFDIDTSYMIPVNPGDEFYMETWAANDGTGTTGTTMGVRLFSTDKTAASYLSVSDAGTGLPTSLPVSTTWTKMGGKYTIPSTVGGKPVGFIKFWLRPAATTGWNYTGWIARKRYGGSLIVDGSIAANKVAAGTYTGGEFIIGSGGILKTANSEVTITSSGIAVTGANSSITASSLTTGTFATGQALTVNGNMTIQGNTNIAASGYIQSNNYNGTVGFRLSAAGLDIRSGTIAVGTLVGGTISSQDIRIGASGILQIDSTGVIRSNNYSPGSTGWQLSSTGIDMPGLTISAGNVFGDTISGRNLVVNSGGSIQSSNYNVTNKTGFRIDNTQLTMYSGTVYGLTVQTDQLRSINGNFSINASGQAVLAGAQVTGSIVVGSSGNTTPTIQSWNYSPGGAGWAFKADGSMEVGGNGTFRGTLSGATGTLGQVTIGTAGTYHMTINTVGTIDFKSPGGSVMGSLDANNGGLYLESATGPVYIFGNGDNYMRVGTVGNYINGALSIYGQMNMNNFGITNTNFITTSTINGGPTINGNPTWTNSEAAGGTANVNWNNGKLKQASSSRRWKFNIEDANIDVQKVLKMVPKIYERVGAEGIEEVGFIAEDAADLGLEWWVERDRNGDVFNFDYYKWPAALQAIAQDQQEKILTLEDKVQRLENLVQQLLDS